jgi:hypothetical protein
LFTLNMFSRAWACNLRSGFLNCLFLRLLTMPPLKYSFPPRAYKPQQSFSKQNSLYHLNLVICASSPLRQGAGLRGKQLADVRCDWLNVQARGQLAVSPTVGTRALAHK